MFVGPYEHHSNELPWRESIADVVTIPEDGDGHVDLAALETALLATADRPLRIGSFSAASNVTGILTDVRAVSALLHRHGALAFWDYAAAGPYVAIDVAASGRGSRRPPRPPRCHLPVTAQVRRRTRAPRACSSRGARCSPTACPACPAVGPSRTSTRSSTATTTDVEQREEGGTPDIIGSIRAGLAFAVKDAVGTDLIAARERALVRHAVAAFEQEPNLEVLGSHTADRLSIVSFVVRHGPGRYLHHDLVVAILNDLFGIQARGGCSCAGPYGHRLLGIDLDRSHRFERGAGDRVRGDQARLGPGELHLVGDRRGGAVPGRRGPTGRPGRVATARRLPLRGGDGPVDARHGRGHATVVARGRPDLGGSGVLAGASGARRRTWIWPRCSAEARRILARRRTPPGRRPPVALPRTRRRCAGSRSRANGVADQPLAAPR